MSRFKSWLRRRLIEPQAWDGVFLDSSSRLDVEVDRSGRVVAVWLGCRTLNFHTWMRDEGPVSAEASPEADAADGGCRHENWIVIATMGAKEASRICRSCGESEDDLYS